MTTLALARSLNGIAIRLTDERWQHISQNHSELAGLTGEILTTIREPTAIFAGNDAEFLAVRPLPNSVKHSLIVVYRETAVDGFIVTAFLTSKLTKLQNVYTRIYH